jgi:uncharacterized membrane protein
LSNIPLHTMLSKEEPGTNLRTVSRAVFRYHFPLILGNRRLEVYLFCHGIPERSFKIRGRALPLCSRCTGVILGSLSFIPGIFLLGRSTWLITLSLIMTAPLVADGATQALGKRVSDNRTRFLTGLLTGCGIALLAIAL